MRIHDTGDLWWKNAVIYCLDVETYMDWNDDGIGDLPGLVQRIDHLADLGSDERLCRALDSVGVRYLYVDSSPWNLRDGLPNVTAPPASGVRRVDAGGSAAVYEVTACG
jgi:hypothetical protein